jgi:hypothetical protein
MNFWRLPARQAARFGRGAGGPDVERLDDLAGERRRRACGDQSRAHQPETAEGTEECILAQRHGGHRAMAVALLRDESGAAHAPRAGSQQAHRLAVDADRVGAPGQRLARQGLGQFGLAVPGDSADAQDLAAGHAQADVLEIGAELLVRSQAQALHDQTRTLALGMGRAMGGRLELVADHELGQPPRRLLPRIAFGDDAPERMIVARSHSAQISSACGRCEDGAAFLRQPPQGLEQPLHLLGRQHRGRLVHDQQLRITQQAAHDLDALAFADREIVHGAVGISGRP